MEIAGNVVLKKGKGDSLLRKHPWVFSGAVSYVLGNPQAGDLVDVTDEKGNFYGRGIFQQSSIIVRMWTFDNEVINKNFFLKRLTTAYNFRQSIGLSFDLTKNLNSNTWRLVYSESDLLSGIIVDIYNKLAVIQFHITGYEKILSEFLEALILLYSENLESIYVQPKYIDDNDSNIRYLVWGKENPEVEIFEYQCKFIVDILRGQKTGFFIDQRENRKLLEKIAYGKTVLNMFSYTGGFTVFAIKGGAKKVVSVDSSLLSIELCEKNIKLNGFDYTKHPCIVGDVYDFFEKNNELFDIIILDPPAFAKHIESRHRAIKGYQRINLLALNALSPNGFLLTFSCSQIIDRKLFESTVFSSVLNSKRNAKVIAELTHAPCHAYSLYHPEAKYLKGLLLYVE